jgi:Glycosyltransferase family 87
VRDPLRHLIAMLVLTGSVVGLGAIQKGPCATTSWLDTQHPGAVQCYTDIPALYRSEQLTGGRLPYLTPCTPSTLPCDEYPVLSMYTLRIAAWAIPSTSDPVRWFFSATAVLLLGCALWTTWCLERVGARTIMFAAAPVLLLSGTTNLDLLAVAAMTTATVAYLSSRRGRAGIALGIGTATKAYPIIALLPFAAEDRRRGRARESRVLFVWTVVTVVVVNLTFALASFGSWSTFFRLNASRPADYDSIWGVPCALEACLPDTLVKVAAPFAIVVFAAWIWRSTVREHRDLPRWVLTFPLLIAVLVFGKVWSPQYSLWLLPWFALTRVPFSAFFAYQLSEILEVLTRYAYFSHLQTGRGIPYAVLAVVILLRAALLLRCVFAWRKDPEPVTSGIRDAWRVHVTHPLDAEAR